MLWRQHTFLDLSTLHGFHTEQWVVYYNRDGDLRDSGHPPTVSAFSLATCSSFSFPASSLLKAATDSDASFSFSNPVFILELKNPGKKCLKKRKKKKRKVANALVFKCHFARK